MLRYLYDRFDIKSRRQTTRNDTRVGTWEILQMMYFDMRQTPCITLAECHHLAWVLGRLAVLQPGSLGPPQQVHPKEHLPFIAWRDFEIERTDDAGRFLVRLTIRNLKTNTINPHRRETISEKLVLYVFPASFIFCTTLT